MNAKPKTELNSFVFIQKWCNVNGALCKATVIPKKETCDHGQKASMVCGMNVGGESNHNPNKD